MATYGWAELMDEQVAGPVRERLYRGETSSFTDEVRESFATLLQLQPGMMEWLVQRYNEQRSTATIVTGSRTSSRRAASLHLDRPDAHPRSSSPTSPGTPD